ncbi:hypothetical protein ACFY12_19975 [Streptomyces sp. NPDC001339]|uniref:hypothetical protein n=1 Tax=Streptomyces sp. NPDC001339 TaxID=3364563 RepID=UPI0036CAD1CE
MNALCEVCAARHDLYEAQFELKSVMEVERENPCPTCQGHGFLSTERYDLGSTRPYMYATAECDACGGTGVTIGGESSTG